MKLTLRARIWIWWHRAQNRWWDARAALADYCNHRPYSPIPGEGGGYAHWRCALRRRHQGLHRSRNYVWSADGRTDYAPVPRTTAMPRQPWERHMTLTRSQQRERDKWLERRWAEMREGRA